jgi:cytoskeleton protein RodZ
MASVGACLRELREKRGVTLEEIARGTRIALPYLRALEADDFAALPEPVFTRGFIRAYCQVVGAPADAALAAYDTRDGWVPPRGPVESARAVMARRQLRATLVASAALVVVLGAALFAITVALQATREPPAAPVATESPRPGSRADAERKPPAQMVAVREEPRVAVAEPPPPASLDAPAPPYRLVARTQEKTWVSVRTRDGRITEETIPAGEVREWTSSTAFVLTIGNAGGITLELNGRPLPPLGARGAVISRLVLPAPRP